MTDKDFKDIVLYEIRQTRKAIDTLNNRLNWFNVKFAVLAVVVLLYAGDKIGLTKLLF